jgi:hypothetical protein
VRRGRGANLASLDIIYFLVSYPFTAKPLRLTKQQGVYFFQALPRHLNHTYVRSHIIYVAFSEQEPDSGHFVRDSRRLFGLPGHRQHLQALRRPRPDRLLRRHQGYSFFALVTCEPAALAKTSHVRRIDFRGNVLLPTMPLVQGDGVNAMKIWEIFSPEKISAKKWRFGFK